MKLGKQTTLRRPATLAGVGVHCNKPVTLVLHPAPADTGIVFIRTGVDGGERRVKAAWNEVAATELCTVLGDGSRAGVSTVEHLLAALAGLGIDNVEIEIDGPEVPIMDGSAAMFVAALDRAGVKGLPVSRRYIRVLKPVRVEQGRSVSELLPAAGSAFHLDVEIDYASHAIGRQRKAMTLTARDFRAEVARARTFGSVRDVERLWELGFALGSSLDNSIAVDGDTILNPEGLRSADEFVGHKMLDAIGDLALAGAPIIGTYRAFCPGHKMNHLVLKALFADRSAYAVVQAPARAPASFKDFALPGGAPLYAEAG